MYKIQQHTEGSLDGKDNVWIYLNKDEALDFFWKAVDNYKLNCGDINPRMNDYESEEDEENDTYRYITVLFTNADESTTQFSFEPIFIQDAV